MTIDGEDSGYGAAVVTFDDGSRLKLTTAESRLYQNMVPNDVVVEVDGPKGIERAWLSRRQFAVCFEAVR